MIVKILIKLRKDIEKLLNDKSYEKNEFLLLDKKEEEINQVKEEKNELKSPENTASKIF